MKIGKIQKGLVVLTVFAGMFAAGCELIVDFDRTKIPVEQPDASVGDANVPETSMPTEGGAEAGGEGDAGDTDASDGSDAS